MGLEGWGAVAFVIVSLEAFILLLIPLAIVFFMTRGMSWVLRRVRPAADFVFGYFRQAHDIITKVMHALIMPILVVNSFVARVQGLVAGIRRQFVSG